LQARPPKLCGQRNRIDPNRPPPEPFAASIMQLAMVEPAQRDHPLIAGLQTACLGVVRRDRQVMSIDVPVSTAWNRTWQRFDPAQMRRAAMTRGDL
jgi:hypothetical protein